MESNFAILAEAYPFASTSRSPVIIELQNGAVPSPEAQTIQKLVKYYLYYKKYCFTKLKCDLLNPKGRNNGKSLAGNRGGNKKGNRGSKRNRGGRKLSKDNKNKNKDKDKKDKSSKDKNKYSRKRRHSDTNSDTENKIYITFSAEVDSKPKKQAKDTAYFAYSTPNREIFIKYRHLNLKVDNIRPIKGINISRTPLGISKVRLNIVTNRRKKDLILTNVLYIPSIPLNLILQGLLIRGGVSIKLVQNKIEIRTRSITAQLQDNNLYYLRIQGSKPTFALPSKATIYSVLVELTKSTPIAKSTSVVKSTSLARSTSIVKGLLDTIIFILVLK